MKMIILRKVRDAVLETLVLTLETVSLSPFNSHETERLFPKVHLVAIKITLIYYTTEGQCLDGILVVKSTSTSIDCMSHPAPNIFSERPFLPFTTALDSVVEKTVTVHLVRYDPIIVVSYP